MIGGVNGPGIGVGPSANPGWLGVGKGRMSGRGGLAIAGSSMQYFGGT